MHSSKVLGSLLCLLLPIFSSTATFPSTLPALNPQLTNTVPNGKGPVLFYNGSGPVPSTDTLSPEPVPIPPLNNVEFQANVFSEILAITGITTGQTIANSHFTSACTTCLALAEVMHIASLTQPASVITNILISACNAFDLLDDAASCETLFSGTGNLGPYWTQLLQKMSMATGDFQAFCHYQFSACDVPPVVKIDESQWFSSKPANKSKASEPSGKTFDVLHISDWHMDPRFDIGSEANCTNTLCCRPIAINDALNTTSANPSLPASRFGYFLCDSPPDLALSAFKSIQHFRNLSNIGFTIFTGDIVSHDPLDQISEALVTYEEEVGYATFKAQLGDIPVFATLGNHDSSPADFNTPNSFTGNATTNIFSWNYDLLSSLWLNNGWINNATAQQASTHYGAYAFTTKQGLKIVSINTDFWYSPNVFNFANFSNPDPSGIMKFLINELEASEKADQRVWIIGHVPSNAGTTNPTALFHAVVRRFSPATIAGIFFGHTHEDEISIYYDFLPQNSSTLDTTKINFNAPLNVALIGPSIVPLTNYNAGWSIYQIDSETFTVVNGQTYFANISNSLQWDTPVWEFEYDTRETYDPLGKWPKDAPLNATFWDGVTREMEGNLTLVQRYNFLMTKSSVLTPACLGQACINQTVCGIRSGDAAASSLC